MEHQEVGLLSDWILRRTEQAFSAARRRAMDSNGLIGKAIIVVVLPSVADSLAGSAPVRKNERLRFLSLTGTDARDK